jgi:hypothetical protein
MLEMVRMLRLRFRMLFFRASEKYRKVHAPFVHQTPQERLRGWMSAQSQKF